MQPIQNPISPDGKKGSKKLLLIIIGIVAILFIAVSLIIAAAVGMYYFTAKPQTPPFEGPVPRPTSTTRPVTGDRTQNIIDVMKKWQTIGDFRLQNVTPTFSDATFHGSLGEAKGIFTSKGQTVIFIVAEYGSKSAAISKVTSIATTQKKAGSKFAEELKMTGGSISAQFSTGAIDCVVFCNWAEGKATLCHQISSENSSALADFRKALRENNTASK